MSGLIGAGLGVLAVVVLAGLLVGGLLLQAQIDGHDARLRPWVVWALYSAAGVGALMLLAGVMGVLL